MAHELQYLSGTEFKEKAAMSHVVKELAGPTGAGLLECYTEYR